MNNNFNVWFDTFVSEKNLLFAVFQVEHNNEIHLIDSDLVIGLVKNSSTDEKKTIKNALVYLDFKNADINDYFKHLATAYVKANY